MKKLKDIITIRRALFSEKYFNEMKRALIKALNSLIEEYNSPKVIPSTVTSVDSLVARLINFRSSIKKFETEPTQKSIIESLRYFSGTLEDIYFLLCAKREYFLILDGEKKVCIDYDAHINTIRTRLNATYKFSKLLEARMNSTVEHIPFVIDKFVVKLGASIVNGTVDSKSLQTTDELTKLVSELSTLVEKKDAANISTGRKKH